MIVFTVENREDFLNLKTEWEKLYSQNKDLTIFQSWDFNFVWYEVFKPDLFIICYGIKKDVKFILPCFIDNGHLKFLQHGFSDFLDVVYIDDRKLLFNSIKKISKFIKKSNKIKSVTLTNLKSSSPILNLFPYFFDNYFIFQLNQFFSINAENFEKNLNSNQRKDLRNIIKKLDAEEIIIKNEKFPDNVVENLLQKVLTHHKRKPETFYDILKFLKALYEKKLIYFSGLKLDNKFESLSAITDLKEDEKLIWIDFYNPDIKTINIRNYISVVNSNKKFKINFGTGAHNYKVKNFMPNIESLYMFYYSKSKIKFIINLFKKVIARALNLI